MSNRLENRLLTGIRVLELTIGPSGGYAGRLLSNSGAIVTKVLRDSQVPSTFRDTGKYKIKGTKEHEIIEIVTSLLFDSWDIILWDSHSCNELDQLLMRSITKKPKNTVGVRLDFPEEVDVNEEHDLQSIGGWMDLTGDPKNIPLAVGGYPATYLVGAHAATAGLLALMEKKWTGLGRSVQVNALSIVVSALEGAISTYNATGLSRSRVGNRHSELTPMSILPSADGWVFIGAPVDEQWELLERWAEIPHQPKWSNAEGRLANHGILERDLANWTRGITREELFLTGQDFRMPFAKVQTAEEIGCCPQLAARNFWRKSKSNKSDIQLPWKVNTNSDSTKERSIPIGDSWKGIRVLDLTSMWSGPYCTRLFADLGVEVIKVEAPYRPDGIRSNQGSTAPFFRELNRNKLGIQLDLNTDSDRQTFLDLVAESDILVENFSPRVMSNFGLNCEELWSHNSNLLIVSLSAFGQTGPYRDFVGYGSTLEAMSGIASLTHYQNGKPWLPGFSISDIGAGIHGAFALIAALFMRNHEGVGLQIDLSQYEAACQFIGDYLIEGTVPIKHNKTAKARSVTELAKDERITKMSIPGGESLIGMPWKSVNWNPPKYPPPKLGQHTSAIKKFIYKGLPMRNQ